MPQDYDFRQHPTTDFSPIDRLSEDEARREAEALRDGINYHDYLYYIKNQPAISDAVYDQLFQRLQEIESAFPNLANQNSPTRRVGAPPADELERVEHSAPMLSLNAGFEEADVASFVEMVRNHSEEKKPDFVVEPKFDGVSVELIYQDGEFVRGATRGDGQTGEDVTLNLRTIRSLPLSLQAGKQVPHTLAVRGEVFLSDDRFQALNRKRLEAGQDPFANPRNAAAGTLRRLDPKQVAERGLDIVVYDILKTDGQPLDSHWKQLQQLARWGLKTDRQHQRCSSTDEIRKLHTRLAQRRPQLSYEVDGIVIKADKVSLWEKLGSRDRSPRWALAWKFEPRQEITVLREIVVQVGMTGMLTPVALLEPVDVGGVTVSRATLHNADEVQRKDVWPGDQVRLARAGDVIPEVVERIKQPGKKRAETFSMPEKCPACKAEVVREGAYHICPAGISCPPQLIGHLKHFATQQAMDIDGLGDETATELVEKQMVHNLADLYHLSVNDLLSLSTFAEKKARKLQAAIQASKKPTLDRFLYALGIRHVGRRVAQVLAGEFDSLESLCQAEEERLTEVREIGPEIAQSVVHFFHEPQTQQTLDEFAQAGVKVRNVQPNQQKRALANKTFVFTGNLQHFTREEAMDFVEQQGGRATSSVSSKTDYLVVGQQPGSKLEEAKHQDVEILDEQQFQQLIEQ